MDHHPGLRVLLAAVAVLVAATCGGPASPLPAGPAVAEVTMDEYAFHLEGGVPPGRVVFHVRNAGEQEHELILTPLPEDFPPVQEQLAGRTRRAVQTMFIVQPRSPGEDTRFAVDLTPGRYAMVCFVTDPDGRTHADKGMSAEFQVQ